MADTELIQCEKGQYTLIAENTASIVIKTRGGMTTARIFVGTEQPDVGEQNFLKLGADDFPFRLNNIGAGRSVWLSPERTGGIEVIKGSESANGSGDDSTLVPGGGITSSTPGRWTELMPADVGRRGAFVQNKTTGSIFILVQDSGFPADGSQMGETEIPDRPAFYLFDFEPKRRYVIRGSAADMPYTLNNW